MKNIRTCIACRTRKEKNELLRIVSKEGMAVLDETKKINIERQKEEKASEITLKVCSSRVLNRVNIGGKPIVQSPQKVQSILCFPGSTGWVYRG